jgi:hypothetical protein
MGYIPHVVMPAFKISPRSCGPSWKRGRGSYTNNYLIKDQVAPEHIWGLIHQGTRPRINPCFRHGYPRTHLGALDISRDLYQPPRSTSKDQSRLRARIPWNTSRGPRIHLGSLLLGPRPRTPVIYWGPSQGSFCLVPDQEPQSSTGGPHKGLSAWSQTKNPSDLLGAHTRVF